jgi:hypothetical protein
VGGREPGPGSVTASSPLVVILTQFGRRARFSVDVAGPLVASPQCRPVRQRAHSFCRARGVRRSSQPRPGYRHSSCERAWSLVVPWSQHTRALPARLPHVGRPPGPRRQRLASVRPRPTPAGSRRSCPKASLKIGEPHVGINPSGYQRRKGGQLLVQPLFERPRILVHDVHRLLCWRGGALYQVTALRPPKGWAGRGKATITTPLRLLGRQEGGPWVPGPSLPLRIERSTIRYPASRKHSSIIL